MSRGGADFEQQTFRYVHPRGRVWPATAALSGIATLLLLLVVAPLEWRYGWTLDAPLPAKPAALHCTDATPECTAALPHRLQGLPERDDLEDEVEKRVLRAIEHHYDSGIDAGALRAQLMPTNPFTRQPLPDAREPDWALANDPDLWPQLDPTEWEHAIHTDALPTGSPRYQPVWKVPEWARMYATTVASQEADAYAYVANGLRREAWKAIAEGRSEGRVAWEVLRRDRIVAFGARVALVPAGLFALLALIALWRARVTRPVTVTLGRHALDIHGRRVHLSSLTDDELLGLVLGLRASGHRAEEGDLQEAVRARVEAERAGAHDDAARYALDRMLRA